jgi:serine/threonine protein kinase
MDCTCDFCSRFELRDSYVRGGLSKVYKAYDRDEDRMVAVKFLDQAQEPFLVKSMWEHEWRALKSFRSSYIVSLVKSGNARCKSALYIATERLAESLQDRLDRGLRPSSLKHWLGLANGLTEALELSHSSEIYHRDLKPGNIMFRSEMDDDWRPVLIDFGAANLPTSTDLETVAAFHTPLYSPPNFHLLDGPSRDLFALAAVLTVVIAKKQVTSREGLFAALEDLNSDSMVKGHLVRVLEKALRPSSDSVFSTVKAFSDGLREAKKSHLSANQPPQQLNFTLTQTAKEAIARVSGEEINLGAFFLRERLDGEFWIRFEDESLKSEAISSFSLLGSQVELVCAVDKKHGPKAPFVIKTVRSIPEVRFDKETQELDELSKLFSVRFLDFSGPSSLVHSTKALDLLQNLLRKQESVSSQRIQGQEMTDFIHSARNLIEARKRIQILAVPEVDFETIEHDADFLVVKPLVDVEVPENANWTIQGSDLRGTFFSLQNVEEGNLHLLSNRRLSSIPDRGRLIPHLGLNEVSFSRQVAALDSIESGDTIFPDFVSLLGGRGDLDSPKGAIELEREDLDKSKNIALSGAMNSRNLYVLEGPPGTGKTKYITALILEHLARNPSDRILIASQTNVAVDNVIERLPENLRGATLRVSKEDSSVVSDGAEPFILDNKIASWRSEIRDRTQGYLDSIMEEIPHLTSSLRILDQLSKLEALLLEGEQFSKRLKELRTTTTAELLDLDLDELPEDKQWIVKSIATTCAALRRLGTREEILSSNSSKTISAEIEAIHRREPELQAWKQLLDIHAFWLAKFQTDEKLRQLLIQKAQIIAGTCIGFVRDKHVRNMDFDLCIIDESSRATSNELLVPISRSRKVVLIGDTRQLPPNDEVLLSRPDIMEAFHLKPNDVVETLFGKLVRELPDSSKSLLTTQYRMAPEIGNLISTCFYDSVLQTVYDESSHLRSLLKPEVLWLDTSDKSKHGYEQRTRSGSLRNIDERDVIVRFLQLVARLLTNIPSGVGEPIRVLVISPYKAQVNSLRSSLANFTSDRLAVRVETLDAVQGLESDLCILSVTRSNPKGKLGFIGPEFWRRINVALSRARHKLVIVGDVDTVRKSSVNLKTPGLHTVLAYMESHTESCATMSASR